VKKLSLKIKFLLISIVGISLISLLVFFNKYTQSYFIHNSQIEEQFIEIKQAELLLNHSIIISSINIYSNNDTIINNINRLNLAINKMLENNYLKNNHPKVYQSIVNYKEMIHKKFETIYKFQTLNSAIKNSTINLSNLLKKLAFIKYSSHQNSMKKFEYLNRVVDVVTSVYLAKNSFDKDFIKNLDLSYFEATKFQNKKFQKFNNVFLLNLNVFVKSFSKYIDAFKQLTSKNSINVLRDITNSHRSDASNNLNIVKIVSYSLIVFVILSASIIMIFLYRLKKDNISLNFLTKKLYKSNITDKLTGLYNRDKYDEDIKIIIEPTLILLNIDRFKYINSYFGSKIGDKVLKSVATIIRDITPKNVNAKFYRLGADEFGILFSDDLKKECTAITKIIIEYFNSNQIETDGKKYNISISAGISTESPYLKNASIALKHVKQSSRLKCIQYSQSLDEQSKIERNIQRNEILNDAIKHDKIKPYFQPIIDNKTKKIYKYEVLARVIRENGKVDSIFPYLEIAKENKLYSHITQAILKESYAVFKNNSLHFSINLSSEDIMDANIIDEIDKLFFSDISIAKRVTFELLESEAVDDYKEIKLFINMAKKAGSKIAIDDFGSGYSNFSHLINLNVDYIKIDGSLIKDIDTNPNSKKIVSLIYDFSKQIGTKTVGEFVENESIYNELKKIGIDFSQGYYFSKPVEKIS